MEKEDPSYGRARPSARRIFIGAALAVTGLAAAIAIFLPHLQATAAKGFGAPEAKPVVTLEFSEAEVVQPSLISLPVVIEFSGPLVAPRTAVVKAKASGTLLGLRVGEGSRVKAGQVLGEIDLADLQTRVAERGAMVDSAQAALAEAQRQHAANVGLASQNFISPTALQSSQARVDSARAQLRSAEAQLATSRIGVREAALVAPISGIVGKRHVVPGEKVSAEQPLLTVVDLSTLEVAGSVGTHEVSLLAPGQAVEVRVEGSTEALPGRIDRIAPAAEAGTRAIGVVVALDNRDERLRAGQYAQARVRLADPQPRLTLPASAVGQASGQDFVWTLENHALVRRIVITGRADAASGRVEVVRGLVLQAVVLAMRFDNLKEGAPARVLPLRTLPTASAPIASAPTASAPTASAPASAAPKS